MFLKLQGVEGRDSERIGAVSGAEDGKNGGSSSSLTPSSSAKSPSSCIVAMAVVKGSVEMAVVKGSAEMAVVKGVVAMVAVNGLVAMVVAMDRGSESDRRGRAGAEVTR